MGEVSRHKQSRSLTIPLSVKFVAMTMVSVLFSQTILQKSSTVDSMGPWVAMYCLGLPW